LKILFNTSVRYKKIILGIVLAVRGAYRVLVERSERKNHLEDTGVDRRIILKRLFKKWGGKAWTEIIWLSIRTGAGHL
jgi:hypothetical protein